PRHEYPAAYLIRHCSWPSTRCANPDVPTHKVTPTWFLLALQAWTPSTTQNPVGRVWHPLPRRARPHVNHQCFYRITYRSLQIDVLRNSHRHHCPDKPSL